MPTAAGRVRGARALVLAVLCAGAPAAQAATPPSPDERFDAHLALAVRNPTDFGFTDAADARGATLGWSYPYFTVPQWQALAKSSPGAIDLARHPAARRLTEVLGAGGELRCVWIQVRGEDGTWSTGVLGMKNLAAGLVTLRQRADRADLVLLSDPRARRIHYADRRTPDRVRSLEIPP